MIYIVNVNSQKFTLNGIPYFKNFMPHVINSNLRVINAYDSKLQLAPFTDYSGYTVNGIVYESVQDLQNALLPILYTRASLGGGTGIGTQDNIHRSLSFRYSGVATRENFALTINQLPPFSVEETEILVLNAVPEMIDLGLPSYYKIFLQNVGKGSYGIGGTTLQASNILIMDVAQVYLQIIIDDPTTQIIDLLEIGDTEVSEYVNTNTPVEVQNRLLGLTVFRATISGESVSWLFLGEGNIYGEGSAQTVSGNFEPLASLPTSGSGGVENIDQTLANGSIARDKNITFVSDPFGIGYDQFVSYLDSSGFGFANYGDIDLTAASNVNYSGNGVDFRRTILDDQGVTHIYSKIIGSGNLLNEGFAFFQLPDKSTVSPEDTGIYTLATTDDIVPFSEFNENINANGHTIDNLANASSAQQPATLNQLDAKSVSDRAYADNLVTGNLILRGNYDLVGLGVYPSTGGTGASGVIRMGNAWKVSVAGSFGGKLYDVGDIFYALVNAPAQDPAKWDALDHNTQQATELVRGNSRIAATSEAEDENTSEDTKFLTPKKGWSMLARFRTILNGVFATINNASFTGTFTLPNGALSITGGSGNNYIRGNGVAANFDSQVRSVPLTGVTISDTPITAASDVRQSLGQAQGQINTLLTGSPFFAINTTTVGLTKSQLNTAYPTVNPGYRVICGSITMGGAIYTKVSGTGAAGVWVMGSTPVVM